MRNQNTTISIQKVPTPGVSIKTIITEEPYDHNTHFHLPAAVMSTLKPNFKDLFSPELLRRCLHGGIQNPHESLNNIIGRGNSSRHLCWNTELNVHEAIALFNNGTIVKCEFLASTFKLYGSYCGRLHKFPMCYFFKRYR